MSEQLAIDDVVTENAVVCDVAGGHDVVAIANAGFRFRLRAAGDSVMLANLVAVADEQITALAGEGFVQRIGSENRSGGDLVIIAQRCPALE